MVMAVLNSQHPRVHRIAWATENDLIISGSKRVLRKRNSAPLPARFLWPKRRDSFAVQRELQRCHASGIRPNKQPEFRASGIGHTRQTQHLPRPASAAELFIRMQQ